MPVYIVKQGDYLSKIARMHGFGDWRVIYDHPENAGFRQKRPDPNLIYPGDEIFIPDRQQGRARLTPGSRNLFKLTGSSEMLKVRIGHPYASEKLSSASYKLTVGSRTYEGTIPETSTIEHPIPRGSSVAELTVFPFGGDTTPYQWTLEIGHLDPAESVSGVQARLNNLGFDAGPVDGLEGPKTKSAVRCFQQRYELPADGVVDEATRLKLKEVYGC